MRINTLLRCLAVISTLGFLASLPLAGSASAQTETQPAQKGEKQKFGPRVNQLPQTSGQQPPKVDLIATHGAWKIQCETSQQSQDGQAPGRQCGMVQSTKSEKNPNVVLTLVMVKSKQGDKNVTMMRVIAPLGVFLPTGVALEIDGEAVGRVPFTRCMAQVCMAFAEASPETLTKMKKGKAANFIIYEAPGLGMPMKLSLEGFSAGLKSLDDL